MTKPALRPLAPRSLQDVRALCAGHGGDTVDAARGRTPAIALRLEGRDRSDFETIDWVATISREVAANGGRRRYRATVADQGAWARATRPKVCKLATNPVLAGIVSEKLQRRWSPQQIAGWLKLTYPDDPGMHVSHESIYRTLFEELSQPQRY